MRINLKEKHEERQVGRNTRLKPSLWNRLERIAQHRAKSDPDVKRSVNGTVEFGLERFAESYEKAHGLE